MRTIIGKYFTEFRCELFSSGKHNFREIHFFRKIKGLKTTGWNSLCWEKIKKMKK